MARTRSVFDVAPDPEPLARQWAGPRRTGEKRRIALAHYPDVIGSPSPEDVRYAQLRDAAAEMHRTRPGYRWDDTNDRGQLTSFVIRPVPSAEDDAALLAEVTAEAERYRVLRRLVPMDVAALRAQFADAFWAGDFPGMVAVFARMQGGKAVEEQHDNERTRLRYALGIHRQMSPQRSVVPGAPADPGAGYFVWDREEARAASTIPPADLWPEPVYEAPEPAPSTDGKRAGKLAELHAMQAAARAAAAAED
jgi:hypothetical protein